MNFIYRLISDHLTIVVWSLVASLMVIYGGVINQLLRRAMKGFPFIIRVGVFILICAVGYGWLSWLIVKWCVHVLSGLGPLTLVLTIGGCYGLVAWLAQQRRLI